MGFDRLIKAAEQKKNPTVAGLDPKLDFIPPPVLDSAFAEHGKNLQGAAAAIWRFNREIIDALCDIVPAVKPQAAYYELYGWAGMRALTQTVAYAREKGLFVIIDGKRGDIGSTMQAYAAAHLGAVAIDGEPFIPFGGDALTVNGYFGADGIDPLLAECQARDKGIFVLCKTSNPSSGEIQNRLIDGEPLYLRMGELCEQWGQNTVGEYGYSAVGAVAGATYPDELRLLREKLPHTFFLVPGYGAQGAGAKDAAPAFDARGRGAIVNSSRAILCAWQKENRPYDFAQAARREALRMRDDLQSAL